MTPKTDTSKILQLLDLGGPIAFQHEPNSKDNPLQCSMRALAFEAIRTRFLQFVNEVGLKVDDCFCWGGSPEELATNLIKQAKHFGQGDKITQYLAQQHYYDADENGYAIYEADENGCPIC